MADISSVQSQIQEEASPSVWVGLLACLVVVAAVILGFTPFTHNLDDLKVTLLHIGGTGMLCLFAWLWLQREVTMPHKWVVLPAVGWIVVMGLTSLLHQNGWIPNANRFQWIGWVMTGQYAAAFGIFLICASCLRTWKLVEVAVMFWVGIVFLECAFGLIHRGGMLRVIYGALYGPGTPSGAFGSLLYTFMQTPDMLGTILNRQFFGDLLALWAPLCLAGAIIWKDIPRRTLCIVSLVFSAVCAFLTYSKASIPMYFGGLIATALGIIFLTKHRKIRIPHLPWILGGCVVVALTVVYFSKPMLVERLKSIDLSVSSRFLIWNGGWEIFKEYPILGGGGGCFRLLFPEFRSPEYHLSQISNVTLWAHNRFIDLLAEHGIVGTLLYLGFLGMVYWRGITVILRGTDDRIKVVLIALLSGLSAYIVTAIFHPGIRWIVGVTPYWAILGMVVGVAELDLLRKETPTSGRRRRIAKPVLTPGQTTLRVGVLAAAILIWVNPLPLSNPFFYSNFGYGIRYFKGAKANNKGLVFLTYVPPRAKEAAALFTEATRQNPTFITSYYKWAHAENVMGNHEGSLKLYQELSKYAPHYSEIHYNLGVIYRLMADKKRQASAKTNDAATKKTLKEEMWEFLDASENEYATAAKMSKKVSVQFAYAEGLAYNATYAGDPEKVTALRKKAAHVYDQIPDLKLTLATQEEGQLDKEKDLQYRAARKAPDFFESVKAWKEAAQACMRVYHEEPGNNAVLKRAVENFKRANDIEGARQALESALTRNTLNFEARNMLAGLMVTQKDDPGARAEALKQSRILQTLSQKFEAQIPKKIQTDNETRLKALQQS